MTGPEHYREAEFLIDGVTGRDVTAAEAMGVLATAQAHATLALAAATALPAGDYEEWITVIRGGES